MDEELLKMSGASAGSVAILLLLYKILKQAVGKRYISNCCGHKAEIGLDIRDVVVTPKENVVPLHIDARDPRGIAPSPIVKGESHPSPVGVRSVTESQGDTGASDCHINISA